MATDTDTNTDSGSGSGSGSTGVSAGKKRKRRGKKGDNAAREADAHGGGAAAGFTIWSLPQLLDTRSPSQPGGREGG